MIEFQRILELVNSEGTILSILIDDSDSLFICGRTDNGKSTIICRTNQFSVKLYLTSRITLSDLFLFSESEHYIIDSGKNTKAMFCEITPNNIPSEISGLSYGNELFYLIPNSSRTEKTTSEIMDLLPAIKDGVKLLVDRGIAINDSQVQFFSEDSPIKLIQVESETQNPTEFDYLSVPLTNGNGELLCRLSPELLKLFLTNSLTIQELFKCQMDKEFYYSNERGNIYKLFYTDGLEGYIDKLVYGNLTYFSLPTEYTIDTVIETWVYYSKNVMSGHGVLPMDFEREFPVEIKIGRRPV